MNRSALVLAAHGSNAASSMNDMVRRCVETIIERNLFDEVTAAFHQGEPNFSTVLDQFTAEDVIVVPMMTSTGYYHEVVLPQELIKNERIDHVNLVCTPPIGTHPLMVSLVTDRVEKILRSHQPDGEDTTLVIIGHGTPRHKRSRTSTFQLADALRATKVCSDILTAFLDDDPQIESIMDRTVNKSILVEPFFIGDGLHTRQDIPRRLGIEVEPNAKLPLTGRVGDHLIIIDTAIGTDDRIVDIILDLARSQEPFRQEVLT